jgi:RNA polymerase sigma-70 factor (ECF subfamily)
MTPTQAERLSVLFDRHADRLYRLARRLVGTADDALDLLQETFLKAARSPASIPSGLADEEAWLVRVLVNIRRDQWRKTAVRKRHEPDVVPATLEQHDPEPALVARADVWRALEHLSPRRRAIVVMSELEELSTASIASLLGISRITVRWHLSRARRELAKTLGIDLGEADEQPQNAVAARRPASSRSTAP